jgi:dTDP-glucose 4,6-dehydratase
LKTLIVTGAAGFIGCNFVRLALAKGYRVVGYDALTYAGHRENLEGLGPNFTLVTADIRDRRAAGETLAKHRPTAVLNFAAESHVDRSIDGGAEFVRTNVVGTHTLIDAAHRAGIKTFVHISTDEVYGSIDEGSWPETHPLQPNSPYSSAKASSDLIALSYHRTHGLDVRVTRCSNNYGHHHFPEKVIPLFVTNLLDGKKVPLYGDGGNVRDWLHIDDHVQGIELVRTKGRPGEVYNIGGGTELSNRELTELLLKACGADWDTSVEYVQDRKGHDRRYSVDCTKIREELGYEPRKSFEQGLAETVQWYRDNRAWWEPLKERAAL